MIQIFDSRTAILRLASKIHEIADWSLNNVFPPQNCEIYVFNYHLKHLKQRTIITIQDLCKLFNISTTN